MLYVVKRDGREVEFDSNKIFNAIKKASYEAGDQLRENQILECIQKIIKYIEVEQKEKVSVEEVQNLVEKALKDSGHEFKEYILLIEEKELELEELSQI